MKIDKNTIKKIAELARLELNEKEIEEFTTDFENILAHFSEIDALVKETKEVYGNDMKNKFREDKPTACLTKKEIFQNTKNKEGDFFVSPKIK